MQVEVMKNSRWLYRVYLEMSTYFTLNISSFEYHCIFRRN